MLAALKAMMAFAILWGEGFSKRHLNHTKRPSLFDARHTLQVVIPRPSPILRAVSKDLLIVIAKPANVIPDSG